MRNPSPLFAAIGLAVMSTSAGAVFAAAPDAPPPTEFEEASIVVERNDTDGDTEVVIALTAGDEGLRSLYMRTPDGRLIASVGSYHPSSEGIREFHFESPEPEGDRILASYPEGLIGSAASTGHRLSHPNLGRHTRHISRSQRSQRPSRKSVRRGNFTAHGPIL